MDHERKDNPAEDIAPEDATPSGDEGGNAVPAPFDTPDEDPTPTEDRAKEAERGG